ncbi:hypothetical protein FIBSPDRAFT_1054619 [Athelia psychrophila]|uniref:Uncharacterized protein n=1 Tax=Athelia psychrophila TaxID=1759441 RepID=A0A167V1J3_9AGAM|nr:hypothetical protein FIBSPDRAFT_1054619 [Fibularhizoctonia sp. CBS 109695]
MATTASPVSKVSTEIFSVFFRERALDCHWLAQTDTSRTLSHVCRQWRYIAIDDPLLWNAIHLGTGTEGEVLFEKLCFERSKQTGLDIFYSDNREDYPHSTRQDIIYNRSGFRDLLEPFDPTILHLSRCRQLRLYFMSRACAFAVLSALKTASAPRLTHIEIVVDCGSNASHRIHWPRPGDIFTGGASLLTFVDLRAISPLQCHIPLQRVTTLVLNTQQTYNEQCADLNSSELVKILREVAPTLQHLKLKGNPVLQQGDHLIQWPELELPALLKFVFGATLDDEGLRRYLGSVCKFLVMPSLEDLNIFHLDHLPVGEAWAALNGKLGARIKYLALHLELDDV